MYNIDNSSAATALPAPAALGIEGFVSPGNPGTGQPATVIDADFLNMVMLTLSKVVDRVGLAHSKSDYTQLYQAILAAQSFLDQGAVNALAISGSVPLPDFADIANGTIVWVIPAVTTTGTTPTLEVDGGTPTLITAPGGGALSAGDIVADQPAPLMKRNSVWWLLTVGVSGGGGGGSSAQTTHGQCYLAYTSTSVLTLAPVGGGGIVINGNLEVIPAGGVAFSNSGLAASTRYYLYAAISGSSIVGNASTTGPALNSAGDTVKNGDATQTLVGLAVTDASGNFQPQGTGTLSFFNKKQIALTNNLMHGAASTATYPTFAPAPSNAGVPFACWGGDNVRIAMMAHASSNVTNGGVHLRVGLDAVLAGNFAGGGGYTADVADGTVAEYQGSPSEGGHTALPYLSCAAAGATAAVYSDPAASGTIVTVWG